MMADLVDSTIEANDRNFNPSFQVNTDVDNILSALNCHEVKYILIGGMNFLLRHEPIMTLDVDIWIEDTLENRGRAVLALGTIGAEWGPTEKEWKPVSSNPRWLELRGVFCLTSKLGALDVFRDVRGLEGRFEECFEDAKPEKTPAGIEYRGLSDQHMLECQLALEEPFQKKDRIRALQSALEIKKNSP